jgi:hypothetical protein
VNKHQSPETSIKPTTTSDRADLEQTLLSTRKERQEQKNTENSPASNNIMSAKQTAARANDQKPSRPQSGMKNTYLLAYNAVSAALWAGVLYQTVTTGAHEVTNARKAGMLYGGGNNVVTAVQRGLGSGKVYNSLESYTRIVQTLAGMEVLHSLFGKSHLAMS